MCSASGLRIEDYVTLRQNMKKRPVDYFRSFIAGHGAFRCGVGDGWGWISLAWITWCRIGHADLRPSPVVYSRTIKVMRGLGLTADWRRSDLLPERGEAAEYWGVRK